LKCIQHITNPLLQLKERTKKDARFLLRQNKALYSIVALRSVRSVGRMFNVVIFFHDPC
jgi:hypothetical protein